MRHIRGNVSAFHSAKITAAVLLLTGTIVIAQSGRFGGSYDSNRQFIGKVLNTAHLSGSLIRSGTCRSHHSRSAQPPTVRAPRSLDSPIKILRDMLSDYPNMNVTQDQSGLIRMVEAGVPTDILDVKIHHLSFDNSSDDSPLRGQSFRGPNMAWLEIWETPEVQSFVKAHTDWA